jgi:hypothetical protein
LPRYWFTSAGWSNATPVSMLPTTMPSPRTPKSSHTSGALIRSMPHSTAAIRGSSAPSAGSWISYTRSAVICDTSGSAATRSGRSASPVTWTVLAIQNDR